MPFCLFDTAIGSCGVAWSERGLTNVLLPQADENATRARLATEREGETEAKPPAWVKDAIRAMTKLLAGAREADLRSIPLDLAGVPPFHAKVYEAARAIEAGRTTSYAELATIAGSPKASRAVGQAMAKNPMPIVIPCHRVLGANGAPGGFSAFGGEDTKRKMLAIEGVSLGAPKATPSRTGARSESLFQGDGDGLLFDAEEAVRALSASDKSLARMIAKVGPLRLRVEAMQTPFQALAESIVYQQLTGKAAATILARVHALHGGPRKMTPEMLLAMPVDKLRMAGLSGSKTAALKDLAAKSIDGTVPSLRALAKLEDDAIVERLTAIRGIGRWTVEMLLMFRLGRPDVLPIQDYGVRKGFQIAFKTKELPTPKEVAARGERWKPYRTAASWYLWRAIDVAKANAEKDAT